MKVKELKEITMSLDDNYDVLMEEQVDKVDNISIQSVEISLLTKEVILKHWE